MSVDCLRIICTVRVCCMAFEVSLFLEAWGLRSRARHQFNLHLNVPQKWASVGQWLAHCVSISLLRVGFRVRFPRKALVVVCLSLVL